MKLLQRVLTILLIATLASCVRSPNPTPVATPGVGPDAATAKPPSGDSNGAGATPGVDSTDTVGTTTKDGTGAAPQPPDPGPELPPAGDSASEEGNEPGDAKAELEKAESLRKQGHYDQALVTLAAARKIAAPDDVRADLLHSLAQTHFRFAQEAEWDRLDFDLEADPKEQFHLALARYDEIARRFPDDAENAPNARYMKGSCWLMLGDQHSALEAYQEAWAKASEDKDKARALLRVGVCQAGTGQITAARRTWNTYTTLYRNNPDLKNAALKVRKYLVQSSIIGRPAAPIRVGPQEWLQGVIPRGLADLHGEVVVLVFFSTGCPHCKKEMPRLRRDIAEWTPRGAVFVGVADPTDPKAESPIDSYVHTNQLDFFDVAIDRGGKTELAYKVTGYPAAAIIGKKGRVRWRGHYAFMSLSLLEGLLAEPGP